MRLPDDVGVPQIAKVQFVYRFGAEDLGIAQRIELSATEIQRVETGYARSGYRTRIGIVEGVVVDEIVGRDMPHPIVDVDARGTLVVADGLGVGSARKSVVAGVGRRNVLQQVLCR